MPQRMASMPSQEPQPHRGKTQPADAYQRTAVNKRTCFVQCLVVWVGPDGKHTNPNTLLRIGLPAAALIGSPDQAQASLFVVLFLLHHFFGFQHGTCLPHSLDIDPRSTCHHSPMQA